MLAEEAQKAIDDYSRFLLLTPKEDQRRAELLFRRSSNYPAINPRGRVLADMLQMEVRVSPGLCPDRPDHA